MGSMHQHQIWPLTLALPAWVPSEPLQQYLMTMQNTCPVAKGAHPHARTHDLVVGRRRPVLTKNAVMEITGARLFFPVLSSNTVCRAQLGHMPSYRPVISERNSP